MSFTPRRASINPTRRAVLGDRVGNVRIPGVDSVYVRLGGTGPVVRARLPYAAVERIVGAADDLRLPPVGWPVWVRQVSSGSPNGYEVITDNLPLDEILPATP